MTEDAGPGGTRFPTYFPSSRQGGVEHTNQQVWDVLVGKMKDKRELMLSNVVLFNYP